MTIVVVILALLWQILARDRRLGNSPLSEYVIHGLRQEASMSRDCFWLTDDQFSRLAPLLPSDTRGKPRVDDRRVISGIVHVLKSGGRWIDAPDAMVRTRR